MTFYEAALRVLEAAGRPMHVQEITEQSIAQNLLSHVGKTPDQTMLSRLAAMARRTRDRRVIVTAKDTFALVDWALPENLEALEQTGVPPVNEEDGMPPLRPTERHPEPRLESVRAGGRGAERKRHRADDEELSGVRQRRFPPLAETVFDVLSDAAQPLRVDEVMQRLRSQALAAGDLNPDQLLRALAEDNQRRLDAGRRAQFFLSPERDALGLEPFEGSGAVVSGDVQRPFADKLGLTIEGGRVVFARAAPGPDEIADAVSTVRAAAKDARRAVARALRRKLLELDFGTFERAVVRCLKALGFHEIRVVKRSREGPLLTARRRDGSAELRYTVRLLKGQTPVDRRAVQELRRDSGRYGAQLTLLASAADLRGEARSEAQGTGGLPVVLWCGEALADRFLDAKTAVSTTQIELFEINDHFFSKAQLEAEEAQHRREERTRERHRPEHAAASDVSGATEEISEAATSPQNGAPEQEQEQEQDTTTVSAGDTASELAASSGATERASADQSTEIEDEGDSDDSEFEEPEETVAAASEPAQGTAEPSRPASGPRRRRRRRRGRRGRGRPQTAVAAAPGDLAQPAQPTPPTEANDEGASPPPVGSGDEK
jgi:hypothetical protein